MTIPVLFDIGPAVHQGAGLAHYAECLAAHLAARHAQEINLELFYNAHSGHTPPLSLAKAPATTLALGQIGWRLSVLLSQLSRIAYWPLTQRLQQLAPAPQRAIYHATEHLLPRLTCPTVLTVHDLIFERYPEHHTRRNSWFLRAAMPRFVAAATAIIAVSQHTRRDLVELYQAPAEKIHVVYEGVDDHFQPATPTEIARVKQQYSPDRPYLLMVGTLEPRKNHATALAALARLKAQGMPHRLLIVGGHGWLFEPIRHLVDDLQLAGDVVFTGYAPAQDLPPLYSGAACVLQPSLYEGFGFPVLEAMACGAPVVCSNVSSLPEVAGDAALLVDALDEAGLAAAVQTVLTDSALAARLSEKGRDQAGRFRWERCAAETVAVYRRVIGAQA